ncbi:MAG: hypothetical protein ACRDPU_12790, partial [Thermoleophilia bacterium]
HAVHDGAEYVPRDLLAEWEARDPVVGYRGTLAALGVSEDELGLTALDETVGRVIGNRRVPSLWGYRVRLGVKGG